MQKQDRQFGLQGAAASAMSRDVTLRYLRDHWDAVLECEVFNVLSRIVQVLNNVLVLIFAPTQLLYELKADY